ncbi:glycosyltransferase family 4 protein [Marinobacterium stanieri]|uniref:Glycosyltransferase involved in cell wall bisynthesis n=1 Tax=Marinobacterium stanieri TaxID=49186 RepID=A0A1N6SC15_9GAMM|nr:glycosyltransferase family 4 protein [Marinobacterium stanieri]SIQ38609.1 Glycosyltransferase involved in cell wall bisynthesis [Marinobacterium stanieri]
MSKTIWIVNQYASTPDYGFAGRHYYLGKELAKLGYKVYLISSANHHLLRSRPDINKSFKVETVTNKFSMVWCDVPSYKEAHSKKRVLGWFFFSWAICKLPKLITDKPDVVVCSSPSLLSFLGAEYIAKKYCSKLVFEVRDIWPLTLVDIGGYRRNNPFIWMMQLIEERAYKKSDLVISNLKNSFRHMKNHGLPHEKFTWIPNGFSLEEVQKNILLNKNVASQVPSDKFIIGYTGTMGVTNALDTLIEAAEKLKNYSEICFVLVGDGKERFHLQSLVSSKKLNNVIFINAIHKAEIQAMLSRFDVCYIGLKKDPLFLYGVSPNKLFDYFYAAKPVIYGIESGDYEPVSENGAGFQIPAENSEKLASAVLKLYQMPVSEREKMGQNGRKSALEQYEYGMLAKKYSSIIFSH